MTCACRDLHDWALDERQRLVCPIRVCEAAVSGMPRRRDYRHVRRIAEDVDLWRPYVIAMTIGICSHPAQAAWTAEEIEAEIARDVRIRAINRAIAESDALRANRARK